MNAPIISVVMSVYNGQGFLSEAVESILKQSFRDFEFVIVDDGSTDGTPEILSSYAKQDQRIRILPRENKGRAESLNDGIAIARGKYIARMDADDIALPHRFKEQIEFLERHPEVGLLGGVYETINVEGQKLNTVCPPLRDADIRSTMLHYNPICHPAVMMRRDVVQISGGYRKALVDTDDYDLWLRMSEHSQMANLEQCILQYRIHAGQVSVRNMKHQIVCLLAARAAAMRRKNGSTDPLLGVKEITMEFLDSVGVHRGEIDKALVAAQEYWMPILAQSDPDSALKLIHDYLKFQGSELVKRPSAADAWLRAARIYYQQGKLAQAFRCAGHGVLARPIVAGRPVKRAFQQLSSIFKNKPKVKSSSCLP